MIVSFVPIYDTFATILFIFHSDSDHTQKRQPVGLPLMNYAVISLLIILLREDLLQD